MVWGKDGANGSTRSDVESSTDTGHTRLHELGYKQELKRDLSVLSNFAFSFSIISVLTGITTLYNTGLKYGGPVTMTFGWFIAGFFTMIVGLSMAEICSSYPTSGGLYYWSAKLSGKKWAPFASWLTGWYYYEFWLFGLCFFVELLVSILDCHSFGEDCCLCCFSFDLLYHSFPWNCLVCRKLFVAI